MFTRHRHDPPDKLNCPHAMGTNAVSPQWAKSFCHILLLPSPHSTPSLRSVAQGRLRLFTTDARCRIFESALGRVLRSYRLYVYGYVVMPEHVHLLLSEPERDTNCPTQAKIGLEWATCPRASEGGLRHTPAAKAATPERPIGTAEAVPFPIHAPREQFIDAPEAVPFPRHELRRLKPARTQLLNRSAEALRHPKAEFFSSLLRSPRLCSG